MCVKKCCKECPWVVRNNNNDAFINHSKNHNKSHNCHMVSKDVWSTTESHECVGYKKYKVQIQEL